MRFQTPIIQSVLIFIAGILLGIIISASNADAQPNRMPSIQRPTAPTRPQGARDTELKSSIKPEAVHPQTDASPNSPQIISQQNIDALAMMLLNKNNTSLLDQTISTTNANGPGRYQISSWANQHYAGYFILDTQTGLLFDKGKFVIPEIKTISKTEDID